MNRFKIGTHVEVQTPCQLRNVRVGDRGIVRRIRRVDPGTGFGYTEYDVELTDGRVLDFISLDITPTPDPYAGQQLPLRMEAV